MLRKWIRERSRMLSRLSLGIWLGMIVAGSLVPNRAIADVSGSAGEAFFRTASNVAHVVAYAGLCLLLIWAAGSLRRPVGVTWSAGAAIAFGVLIEVLQPLTGRSCSAEDAAFDVLGVLAALVGIAVVRRARSTRLR
jgi:VanZ family protein